MPRDLKEYKVFIASPGNLQPERTEIARLPQRGRAARIVRTSRNILCGRARRIQTPVGKSLQVQEVSYVGLTESATPQPLFEFAIRAG